MSAFKFLDYLLLLKPFYTYRTCPMAFFHYHCLYFLRVSHLHWHFDGDWWHWLQNNKELIIIILYLIYLNCFYYIRPILIIPDQNNIKESYFVLSSQFLEGFLGGFMGYYDGGIILQGLLFGFFTFISLKGLWFILRCPRTSSVWSDSSSKYDSYKWGWHN